MEMSIEHAKRIVKADERAYQIGWLSLLLGLMGTLLLWNRPDEISIDHYALIKCAAYGALTLGWIMMEKSLSKRHFIILPALGALMLLLVEHDLMLFGGKLMGVLIGAFIAYVKLPNIGVRYILGGIKSRISI